MDQVGLSRETNLSEVDLGRKDIGLSQEVYIRIRVIGNYALQNVVESQHLGLILPIFFRKFKAGAGSGGCGEDNRPQASDTGPRVKNPGFTKEKIGEYLSHLSGSMVQERRSKRQVP
jgi:hypothetical protein